MPSSCCVSGCFERQNKGFFRIPQFPLRRTQKWILAINRSVAGKSPTTMTLWTPGKSARVCSKHFVSGKPVQDPDDIDWVPSQRMKPTHTSPTFRSTPLSVIQRNNRNKLRKELTYDEFVSSELKVEETNEELRQQDQLPSTVSDPGRDPDPVEVLSKRCSFLEEENQSLRKELSVYQFSTSILTLNSTKFQFYTGVTVDIFNLLVSIMQIVQLSIQTVSLADQILVALVKIKTGCSNVDLAYRFGFTECNISRCLRCIIPALAQRMKIFVAWPSSETVRKLVPKRFRKNHKRAVCIIDCTEIFIDRPSSTKARAATYSQYKHHNTVKFLIGCTLDGTISFISEAWGGRASDNHITKESGFLQNLNPGDVVLADRGFNLVELFAFHGVKLVVPSFTKGRAQLPGSEVEECRKISNVRIHIERVIGRTKNFNIISSVIPISQVDLLEDIMTIVCALTNLKPSVVPQ